MKKVFLNNLVVLLSAREKILNSFKSILFPIKNLDKFVTRELTPEQATEPEAAKETATESTKAAKATKATKHKTSSLKLRERFLNEIKNEVKKYK